MSVIKTATPPRRLALSASATALVVLLGGCATTIQNARGGPGQRLDPWENWNRKVFAFNEDLDAMVLKPVATGYAKVVPRPVRRSIDNFFNNASDAWSAVNNLLQGKVTYSLESAFRFGANTLFGVVGLVDVATDLGLERRPEDFGQTLGTWGVGAGAYVVWPLFGPSSVRDSLALPLDRAVSPALLINGGGAAYGISFLQVINSRANFLGASQVLDDIALDKYTFLRDAYLQRRRSLVYDGDEPDASDSSSTSPTTADSRVPDANAPAAVAQPPAVPASGSR